MSFGAPAARKKRVRKPWTLQRARFSTFIAFTFLLLYVARRVNGKFNEATPPNVPQPLIGLGRAAVDPSEHL